MFFSACTIKQTHIKNQKSWKAGRQRRKPGGNSHNSNCFMQADHSLSLGKIQAFCKTHTKPHCKPARISIMHTNERLFLATSDRSYTIPVSLQCRNIFFSPLMSMFLLFLSHAYFLNYFLLKKYLTAGDGISL